MKRFHISIAVADFDAALADYSQRLACQPCVVAPGRYALWRNELLNFSISCKDGQVAGVVRHIGFEDDAVQGFREEQDTTGLTWEYFNQAGQLAEILDKFPGATHGGDA
jgi:hypothetical protein